MLQRRHRHRNLRAGNILPLVAISLVLMMTVAAISLDGGLMFAEHRRARATADASALAAAADLYQHFYEHNGLDVEGTALASALATAAANGYANDGVTTVNVFVPPTSGSYVGRAGYVEVVTTHERNRSFSRVLGTDGLTVMGRAVALGAAEPLPLAILVLHPTTQDALDVEGAGQVNVTGAPVRVNSTHNQSATTGEGGIAAPEFYFRGGFYDGGGFQGSTHTNAVARPDPFAALPEPNPNTMTVRSSSKVQLSSGSMTLQPGVYQGGIEVTGTGSMTLEPGVYYVDGGGFAFSGQGSLSGAGVMIYNDPNSYSEGISIATQGPVNLTPPTTGPYQGMTIFQERDQRAPATIAGNGQTAIQGTIYLPRATLNIQANGSGDQLGSQWVSRRLRIYGSGTVNLPWQADKVALARTIYLVE